MNQSLTFFQQYTKGDRYMTQTLTIMTDGRCHYFHPLQPGHKIFSLDEISHQIMGTVIEAHIDLAHFH